MKFFGVSTTVLAVLAPVAVGFLYLLWWRRQRELDDEDSGLVVNRTVALGLTKTNKTNVEIRIPACTVGWVIGRGGQNIRKIEHETGCRVKVGDRPQDEKEDYTVALSGHRDQVAEAEEHIRAFVAEKLSRDAQARAERFEMELIVPGNAVGRVIGRQGQTIRGIERTSGARVKVEKVADGYDGEKHRCMISGTAEQVAIARDCVQQILAEEEEFVRKRRERRSGKSKASSETAALPTDHPDGPEKELGAASPDWAKLVSRLPATDEYVPVYVSALCDVHRFWVQHICRESKQLDGLVDRMTEDYETLDHRRETLSVARIGDVCAALFEFDQRWYRARIMDICDDDLTVFYLDFGDSRDVKRNEVKPLREEYAQLPFQAVLCSLAGVEPLDGKEWGEDAVEAFNQLTYCAQWKILMLKVVERPPSQPASLFPEPFLVELVDTNSSSDTLVLDELVRLGHARQSAVTNGETTPVCVEHPGADQAACVELPVGQFAQLPVTAVGGLVSVSVTAVKDPHHFTVQLSDNGPKLEELCDNMTEFYSSLESDELCLADPKPGTVCCATYAHDETWHRAMILEQCDDKMLSVQYLDYGDISSVQIEHVKKLKEEYMSFPFQLINCCMASIEPADGGEKWSGEAVDQFESFTHLGSWKPMLLNVLPGENRSLQSVEIFDPDNEGVSVAEAMVSDGLAMWADGKHEMGARTSLSEPVSEAVEKARLRMEEEEDAVSLPTLPVWKSASLNVPRKRSDNSIKIAANFRPRSNSTQN